MEPSQKILTTIVVLIVGLSGVQFLTTEAHEYGQRLDQNLEQALAS